MDDLYKTPSKNGDRTLDQDEITMFQTPKKGLVDNNRHPWKAWTTPATGLPTSNRDNVIDALKNIQDRIRTLEVERTTAEENLRDLSKETTYYRQSLERLRADSPKTPRSQTKNAAPSTPISPARSHVSSTSRRPDLQEQLRSADARCELLDKQLDYMRKMLNEAEVEKRLAYERSEQMSRLRNANTSQEMKTQMEKIADMEREHYRLQANQAIAQERIKELEKALEATKDEQYIRVPTNLSAELRSAAQTNKILIEKLSPPTSPKKNQTVPNKQKKKKHSKKIAVCDQPQPGQHYRLNMADIPFVVGQSTAPSHRVGSNVQSVIAMMKNHNKELCAAAGKERIRAHSAPGNRKCGKRDMIVVSSTADDSSESETELQEMMDQLTEEYTHMAAEHHELTREMDAATNRHTAANLQHEIERLEIRMSTKAEQIAKLSAHQNKLREKRAKISDSASRSSSRSMKARKAYKVPSSSTTGEVQVTTTIKTKGKRADKVIECRPRSRQDNLRTLNSMKTLKTRLKPDDLHWTT